MSDSRILSVKPIIHYPRVAQVGKTYLMTIDLEVEAGAEWQYEEEEYPIYCTVDSELFNSNPVGEPVVVMHRFGGSYGEANFLLTASSHPCPSNINIHLINRYGVSLQSISLKNSIIVEDAIIDEAALSRAIQFLPSNGSIEEFTIQSYVLEDEPEEFASIYCHGTARLQIVETGEIFEVNPNDLEWETECIDPDRPMGAEWQHTANITFQSERGSYIVSVIWIASEYPEGDISPEETIIESGIILQNFDGYIVSNYESNFFDLGDTSVNREEFAQDLSGRHLRRIYSADSKIPTIMRKELDESFCEMLKSVAVVRRIGWLLFKYRVQKADMEVDDVICEAYLRSGQPHQN
jgi:hypothetical protein